MRTVGLILAALAVTACTPQGTKDSTDSEIVSPDAQRAAIAAAIDDSVKGWKEGDMKRFLNVYSDSADTMFVTDKGVAKGKAQMEANYRDGWAFKDDARRRDISTEVIDFRSVGADHAMAVVKFSLKPEDDKQPPVEGYSTLLFQKEPGGWKVIVDHSG